MWVSFLYVMLLRLIYLKMLQRVEERGANSVALLLRQWSSAIFRYAVATLRADT